MMLVGYCRVSTAEQCLDLQTDALKLAGCQRMFTEHASGGDRDRPELTAALAFCRKGDVFVFWKLDRVARSVVHLGEIAADLERRGVGMKCLTDPIDTTTAGGKMMFNILASFAQFERDLGRERTMAGLAAARAKGRTGGRKAGIPQGPRKRVLIPGHIQEATV